MLFVLTYMKHTGRITAKMILRMSEQAIDVSSIRAGVVTMMGDNKGAISIYRSRTLRGKGRSLSMLESFALSTRTDSGRWTMYSLKAIVAVY
jgi:predicted metal-dependent phosphotriesterase family hydrolase